MYLDGRLHLLSTVQSTYSGFFFITLEEWAKRKTPEMQFDAIRAHINRELHACRSRRPPSPFRLQPFRASAPQGGVTFILEDRSGQMSEFLAEKYAKFILAAQETPGIASLLQPRFCRTSRRYYVNVDQAPGMIAGREPHRCLSNVANLSWAAISSTTSTASAANGRSTFRRKGLSDRPSRISGCFYVATRTATRSRSRPLSSGSGPLVPSSRCATTSIAAHRSTQAVAPGYSTGQP